MSRTKHSTLKREKHLKLYTVLVCICMHQLEQNLSAYAAKVPTTLPLTVPEELTMYNGKVLTNPYDDTWTVPYQHYMLTKVEMWKNGVNTSGFEVTFEPYPPSEFSGWQAETHMFGFTDQTSE